MSFNTQPQQPLPAQLHHPSSHPNTVCSVCRAWPIVGFRYQCQQCPQTDFCEHCFRYYSDDHDQANHSVVVWKKPASSNNGSSLFGAVGQTKQGGRWTVPVQSVGSNGSPHSYFTSINPGAALWGSPQGGNNSNDMSIEGAKPTQQQTAMF